MKYDDSIAEFWKLNGLNFIKPPIGGEFPEGQDVRILLHDIVQDSTVVEIGCGVGRLAGRFSPRQYNGFDINHAAIDQANESQPEYSFHYYNVGDVLPPSDFLLAYTVLLHVSDDDITNFVKSVTHQANNVIIGEILGREWRREGNPPVFNRSKQEYDAIMEVAGFRIVNTTEFPYANISRADRQARMTILHYKRES